MANWYVGSVQHAAIAQFAASHAYSVGDIVRQLAAPTAGNERAFRCTTAGTSGGSEPSWSLTKGSTTATGSAVFTEVTGNATYGWSAAAARVDHIITTWAAAGDSVFCASDHDETWTSSKTLGMVGTLAAPLKIISVNPAGSVPPVSADLQPGADIRTTGASNLTLTSGGAIWHGINLHVANSSNAGSLIIGTSGTAWNMQLFYDCFVEFPGTHSSSAIQTGQSDLTTVLFDNTPVSFGAAGQHIEPKSGNFTWRNTPSAVQGTAPTSLFVPPTAQLQCRVVVENCDLNGATGNLVGAVGATQVFNFFNCRVNASATLCSSVSQLGAVVSLVNCDDGATQYKQARQDYAGKLTHEATILRSGGASDGTTPISHKVVTNANASKIYPHKGMPIIVWNSDVGASKTATIEIVNDGTTLKDDEVWLELDYLGNSSYPLGSCINTCPDILASGASLASSSESWTTTGLASPVKQKVAASFTPQLPGWVRVTPNFARASKTIYYDPKLAVA